MPEDSSPSIDWSLVERWLDKHDGPIVGPLRVDLIAGGLSNYSFILEDDRARRWVFRCPPANPVVASAHDVEREARLQRALAGTNIPVPALIGFEPSLLNVPFYVMHYVKGKVVHDMRSAEQVPLAARRRIGGDLSEILGRLHSLDPRSVGLDDLGRGTGYIERQLRGWKTQAVSNDRPIAARVSDLHDRLLARVPTGAPVRIVHGDYRLSNVIIEPASGEVRAVLDWELSTLGDPYADLAVLLLYWSRPGDRVQPMVSAPTVLPGFSSKDELLAAYLHSSGLPHPEDMGFYRAFASWRLAIALDGVENRFAGGLYEGDHGQMSAEAVNDLPRAVGELLDEAERLLHAT